MTDLDMWLSGNGVFFRVVNGAYLIFDQPRSLVEAQGAAITSELAEGKLLARNLRARGWAVCSTNNHQVALRWLASLGYGGAMKQEQRTPLRVPKSYRGAVDLAWLAACVVDNPAAGAVELAREFTNRDGKPVDRFTMMRALDLIGWGKKQREAYGAGLIGAPVLGA